MDLYIFPILPSKSNGYGIAVASDFARLNPKKDDVVIWYTSRTDTSYRQVLKRPSKLAFSRATKVLLNKVNCEVTAMELKKIDFDCNKVDSIFCGDVIFYRALRKIFPQKMITVRFHNCFGRIKDRIRLIDEPVNLKFKIQANAFYRLEKEIFKDTNTYKIFITKEDRDYYTSNFGIESDSEVWAFVPDMNRAIAKRNDKHKNKLVHFGGIQSHKIDGLKWFVKDVFLPLREKVPAIEFHLYGNGTESFDDKVNGIYGHGFYKQDGLPDTDCGLYINPDLIGGGVKIKLMSYFEEGASFITTPFGYEGYPKELIDNQFYYVVEKNQWLPFLIDFFLK